ncbi:MAG: 30S ribosomal protein S6 [Acidobacteria bacterium]|nr:MAG: 30S ribosomal protein S6 [Acidobacteriota bacterium]
MVIFSPALTDEDEREQSLQVENLVKHEKGNIHLVDHWGKRKLAYNVKKQRQGFYEWYYFELDPGRVAEIDRKLKMSETILRFMCLKMEKIQIQNLQKEIARRSEASQPSEPAPAPAAEPAAAATEAPVEEQQPAAAEATQEPGQET